MPNHPPLPEGACHWEIPGVGIVKAAPWCEHVKHNPLSPADAREFRRQDEPESYNLADVDLSERIDAAFTLVSAEIDVDWPSVLYENPADFFDDNQVIDG